LHFCKVPHSFDTCAVRAIFFEKKRLPIAPVNLKVCGVRHARDSFLLTA